MAQQKSLNATRLDGIDALRGLAIFFVLMKLLLNMRLRFAEVPYADGLPEQVVSSLGWNGQRGVLMFFAISGFLFTSGNPPAGAGTAIEHSRARFLTGQQFARITAIPYCFVHGAERPLYLRNVR